jgi:metal-dependent HD superfamily phosphatase/phosphodiesterase
MEKSMIRIHDIKENQQIRTYIQKADETLEAMGYTEHAFAHVTRAAHFAQKVLLELGYPERMCELAWIAGYMHDIGNVVNRIDHAQSGALMAFRLLDNMGMDAEEIAMVCSAIGNHDESTAFPVNPIAAALILADKTDVRRTRVRNQDMSTFDIHDRVNYAVEKARTELSEDKKSVILTLEIDTGMSPVINYFEIFLDRMLLCRKAAEKLGLQFNLVVNGQQVL